jgi:protein involved in polysaccharide export with SLBB domain
MSLGLFILVPALTASAYAQLPQDLNSLESSGQAQDEAVQQQTQTGLGQYQSPLNLGPQTGALPSGQFLDFSNPSNYSDLGPYLRQPGAQNRTQPAMPLRPEPLTEYQQFVASTTGQILPIFGASLFNAVPSTFAPLDMTPVPSDYVIGPGDELRIRVWGQINFQANVRVDRLGEAFLPQVGSVHVAGIRFSDLDAHLRAAIGRVYHNYNLTADLGQIRSIQVYVAGQARRPGLYTVSSLSSLVDALFASGGPSLQGSTRHILLRRGSAVVAELDLYELLIHGDKSKDAKLQSGDVIFIPAVGPQAAITGSVRNSAIFELKANESLADLVADAGGISSVASSARVSIERIEDRLDRHVMEVAYDARGMETPLADGDIVRVYSILPRYRKSVTLRGNTANPGRFAWHPGMRVSDLIPDREALITRNYWWKRAQLGLPALEFEPVSGLADMRQPPESQPVPLKLPASGDMNSAGRFGLQQNRNPRQNGNQNQNQSQSQDQSLNQDQGQEQSLSTGQNRFPGSAQRTEIRALAPEIDWDYAVIERLDPDTLKSTLIQFDLGKVVQQHDATQDLELQAGDVVSIFSEADIRLPIAQETKLVMLDGEFTHAGMYTAQPGETLRHLVERVGGFTPSAYLYASVFTRESTRVMQQARIDEYVQTLGIRIARSSLAVASSQASSTQDLASDAAAQNSERDLLESLRRIRATGRIVFNLTPKSTGADNLPDVALEDGDRFFVPSIPAVVNVIGSVNDQNSFLFAPGNKIGDYLKNAGGANRDADRRREFVIRANGQVVSLQLSNGLWGNQFNEVAVYPGDTIVVPEKTFKISTLRGVLDWSQMFSQFALGAAAISIIK